MSTSETMTIEHAVMLCEGMAEPSGETSEEKREQRIAAWQLLIDEGTVWSLQGWFGRSAIALILDGWCDVSNVEELPPRALAILTQSGWSKENDETA